MPSTALPATNPAVVVLAVIDLPSATLIGITVPPPPVPVPASGTRRAASRLVTVRVALRAPAAAGVNATLIVQVAPAPRLAPQVVVCANSPELVVTPLR